LYRVLTTTYVHSIFGIYDEETPSDTMTLKEALTIFHRTSPKDNVYIAVEYLGGEWPRDVCKKGFGCAYYYENGKKVECFKEELDRWVSEQLGRLR